MKNKINKLVKNVLYKLKDLPRHYYVFGFFLLSFFIIILNVFSYTVKNYEFYKDLADKQQIGEVKVPVTRGSIFSSTNSGTVLGTSVNLNDLAIDPTAIGDKTKLGKYLTDIVYNQTCYLKTEKICYEGILRFLKKLEIENFSTDEKYLKDLIYEDIKEKITRTVVTSVLITNELTNEQLSSISNLLLRGVYPNENGLYINPEEVQNPDEIAEKIYKIVGMEKEDIKNMIRKRKLQYVSILNKLSIGISEEINKYMVEEKDAVKKGIITEDKGISNFIIMSSNHQRYYPEEGLASQVVGFVDSNGEGHYGIEGYFNDILKGGKGKLVSRNDIKGRIIDPIVLSNNLSLGGADIYTTIDRNIQKKVEEVLEAGVKQFDANKGMVTVMDPKTGEILAMANYPTYDSNNPGDVYELEKVSYAKYPNPKMDLLGMPLFLEDNVAGKPYLYGGKKINLREISREEFTTLGPIPYKYKNNFGPGVYQNDTISALFEPGSIMKAITMAIGIDSGEINKYSTYEDKGSLKIDQFTIKNVVKDCLGVHDFRHALDFSCNIGMIRIAQRIGKAVFYQYLVDFGFSNITDITLEGEVYSKLDPYERWPIAKLFTVSYGLGVGVTQLQMATAYSVLANGGLYVKPRIIDYIKYNDGRIFQYKTEITHRVIKESTSKFMTDSLVESVEKGVAKTGRVEGYTIAGKTGTSKIAYKGGYEEGLGTTNGSFAGYGPAEDPKFVMVVTLVRPRGNTFGGGTSSYMFSEIAKYLFDYYAIPKKADTKKK